MIVCKYFLLVIRKLLMYIEWNPRNYFKASKYVRPDRPGTFNSQT